MRVIPLRVIPFGHVWCIAAMANRQGIAVSTSRFACLKIEDDEEEEKAATSKSTQQPKSANASKKKNKKRKDNKDTEQLKNLAFGKGTGGGKNQPQRNGAGDGGDEKIAWDQWQEHDKELVEEQFKDDLAKALLQSRLEAEQKEQEAQKLKERIELGIEMPTTREGRKKKKQKEKPQSMSLEEFKQLPPEKPVGSDSDDDANNQRVIPPVQTRVPPTQQDPKFFNSVQDDAEHILRQEKMQEEYRKQYASDSVIVAKLKNDLEQKETELQDIKSKVEDMENELKQVKKRNKQLCVILAQGEMKDKAQVLLQVDELTAVKDELTEQVTSLTAELEKEKSKNHSLKSELDKLKAGKHGSK